MRVLYRPVVLNEPILTTGYISLEQFGGIGTRFCLPSNPDDLRCCAAVVRCYRAL